MASDLRHLLNYNFFVLTATLSFAIAFPPQPPVKCNATSCFLSNAYGVWGDRRPCRATTIVYPETEPELVSAVANAVKQNFSIKVVTGFSHTIPKLACPADSTRSLLISTAKYNSNVSVDVAERTVTADAGVGLRELVDAVELEGLSLPVSPYWEGVSVAGMVSTGSLGSSWWGLGGSVHDHLVQIRIVLPEDAAGGYAKVVTVKAGDPFFDAAKLSLGLLGAISKVTFSLQPAFKRSITYSFQDDGHLEDEVFNHAKNHEFGDITWYPSKYKAVYRIDDRVPFNVSGDGVNDFIGFQANPVLVSTAVRTTEKTLEEAKNSMGKCSVALAEIESKTLVANGLKNDGLIFTGYPVIGRQSRMQTSGSCQHSPSSDILSSCAWDPRIKGLFFYETTAIFSATRFRDFIIDVKKLRDINPVNFCGVDMYNGFLIRFIKGSTAYLGQSEDSVVVDFNYYRADDPSTPRLNQDVWEEVEQMAFFKHGAKPHWAKNRKVAFLGVQQKYANFGKFIDVKNQIDPNGLFSSPWSDEVLHGFEGAKDDGCALEGQCICSEDRHCSPTQGYVCRSGLVYKEAMVCRFSRQSTN